LSQNFHFRHHTFCFLSDSSSCLKTFNLVMIHCALFQSSIFSKDLICSSYSFKFARLCQHFWFVHDTFCFLSDWSFEFKSLNLVMIHSVFYQINPVVSKLSIWSWYILFSIKLIQLSRNFQFGLLFFRLVHLFQSFQFEEQLFCPLSDLFNFLKKCNLSIIHSVFFQIRLFVSKLSFSSSYILFSFRLVLLFQIFEFGHDTFCFLSNSSTCLKTFIFVIIHSVFFQIGLFISNLWIWSRYILFSIKFVHLSQNFHFHHHTFCFLSDWSFYFKSLNLVMIHSVFYQINPVVSKLSFSLSYILFSFRLVFLFQIFEFGHDTFCFLSDSSSCLETFIFVIIHSVFFQIIPFIANLWI
jgi:hypothetical protein